VPEVELNKNESEMPVPSQVALVVGPLVVVSTYVVVCAPAVVENAANTSKHRADQKLDRLAMRHNLPNAACLTIVSGRGLREPRPA
jgi:hypothetical protein